jgi:hypothetical protein
VQRRKRPKVEPRNVFGGNLPPRPIKKPVVERKQHTIKKSTVRPPSAAIPIPEKKIVSNPILDETNTINSQVVENGITEEIIEEDNVLEDTTGDVDLVVKQQILGKSPIKGIGLKKKKEILVTEEEVAPSTKALELIEKSRLRANEISITKVSITKVKTAPKPIVRKPRGKSRQKNYQPAARLKRLDRSKHMEYKYEMRSLLIKLNVVEEYRSNLLASIWAKGERQSTKEAREYIDEKRDEGILDEKQHKSLSKIIDNYTTRR